VQIELNDHFPDVLIAKNFPHRLPWLKQCEEFVGQRQELTLANVVPVSGQ
jgi:hypothetical protein